MATPHPHVIVLAGPNGAGKSTAAPALLAGTLEVTDFVNADVIAQGLSAFHPETTALDAGRIMLARLRQLARQRSSLTFETTLASKSFAQAGGHDVPVETIRRRFFAGLQNFFDRHRPLADRWRFYHNPDRSGPRLIATGCGQIEELVCDPQSWQRVREGLSDAGREPRSN